MGFNAGSVKNGVIRAKMVDLDASRAEGKAARHKAVGVIEGKL